MEDSYTIEQKASKISDTEEDIINYMALKEEDEQYIGKPETAKIIDFDTEGTDSVIEFYVELPNKKVGKIKFTEYMVDKGKLTDFLDMINCTISDFTEMYTAEIPVSYTEHKGWMAFYSNKESELTTYKGKSWFRKIDSKEGLEVPSKNVTLFYHSLFIISLISIWVYTQSAYFSLFSASCIWFITWYCEAAFGGSWYINRVQIEDVNK